MNLCIANKAKRKVTSLILNYSTIISNIRMRTQLSVDLLIIFVVSVHLSCGQSTHYNESLCTDIEIDSFHFFINEQ